MFKLVKLAFVVGALVAVWMLVPVGGRTAQARWAAAGSPAAFARGAWAELERALSAPPTPKPKAAPADREKGARPTEAHTERDRAAVDQIVAEHLRR
jgi:hypothetical protein